MAEDINGLISYIQGFLSSFLFWLIIIGVYGIYYSIQRKLLYDLFLLDRVRGFFSGRKDYYSFIRIEKAIDILSKKIDDYNYSNRNFCPELIFAIAGQRKCGETATVGGAIVGGLLGHKINSKVYYIEISRNNKYKCEKYKEDNEDIINKHIENAQWPDSILVVDDVSRSGRTIEMLIELIRKSYKNRDLNFPEIGVGFIGMKDGFLDKIEKKSTLHEVKEVLDNGRLFYCKKSKRGFIFPWKG